MKIIFTDTNKILLALNYRKKSPDRIAGSGLRAFIESSTDIFYVSNYIVQELYEVYTRNYGPIKMEEVFDFLEKMGFKVVLTKGSFAEYRSYVYDINDAPVLRDAIYIDADYLWTHNVKDFNIDEISKVFNVHVIQYLPRK